MCHAIETHPQLQFFSIYVHLEELQLVQLCSISILIRISWLSILVDIKVQRKLLRSSFYIMCHAIETHPQLQFFSIYVHLEELQLVQLCSISISIWISWLSILVDIKVQPNYWGPLSISCATPLKLIANCNSFQFKSTLKNCNLCNSVASQFWFEFQVFLFLWTVKYTADYWGPLSISCATSLKLIHNCNSFQFMSTWKNCN
jgi:hypothetical protein